VVSLIAWELRCAEAEETLSLWHGLFAGRWSIVGRVDHDGRRYLFARRSEPERLAWESLTASELETARRAATGQSNKVIAYDQGCSPSTVAMRLARAARKLGLETRLELIRAYRRRSGP
jgi:DNA-binding CsgD family transcriptional regulator